MAAVAIKDSTLFSDTNLVSYWSLDGNSSDSKDSNNGTDTDITYSAANGQFVQGAGFNGTSSKIVIADAANLKIAGSFSILGWIKTSLTSSNQTPFQCGSLNTNRAGYRLLIDTDDKLYLYSGKNTGTAFDTDWSSVASGVTVCDGVYHMFVFVYDGSQLKMSIDGAAFTTKNWANNPGYAATNYIRIGCKNNAGTDAEFWNGVLDDLAVFDRALTITEIANHYSGADALVTANNNLRGFFEV